MLSLSVVSLYWMRSQEEEYVDTDTGSCGVSLHNNNDNKDNEEDWDECGLSCVIGIFLSFDVFYSSKFWYQSLVLPSRLKAVNETVGDRLRMTAS